MKSLAPSPMVYDALGQSLIYEDYKGDFAQARRVAEKNLAKARLSNDQSMLADSLLDRGIVHLYQGEPAKAWQCFAAVEQTVSQDTDRLLFTKSYAILTTQLRFLIFPADSASSTLEIQSRWNQLEESNRDDAEWAARFEKVISPEPRLQASLLYWVIRCLPINRFILEKSNELADTEETLRRFQMVIQPLALFRQQAQMHPANPSLIASIDRLLGDLSFRANLNDEAQTFLQQAHKTFAENEDMVGVATCWLTFGDRMCAPMSSPLVWNHLMIEGDWCNTLTWTRERDEFDLSKLKISQALQAYAEAQSYFQQAGCQRGLGFLALRLAYLDMLNANPESALRHIDEAEGWLTKVEDHLGVWLASAHRLAVSVQTISVREASETARAIGDWGKREGSFSYATGLGLFLVREGRRWLIQKGDFERAMNCYHLARVIFQTLGAEDNQIQVNADQGIAYNQVGDYTSAVIAYEQARDSYLNLGIKNPALGKAEWQKAVLAADEVCQLAQVMQEAEVFERSIDRLHKLYEQPINDGIDLFGERFGDTLPQLVQLRSELAATLVPLFRALKAEEEGDGEVAERYFKAALQAGQHSSDDQKNFLEASVLRVWKKYEEAEKAFTRYLNQGGAKAGYIGDLSARMAENFGKRGKQIAEQRDEQTLRFAASFYVSIKAFVKAQEQIDELKKVSGETWWVNDEHSWESLRMCGETCEGLGKIDEALNYYDQAIDKLEARRKLLTRDEIKVALASETGSQYLYFFAARATAKAFKQAEKQNDVVAQQRYGEMLLGYAEHGKARALFDLIAANRAEGVRVTSAVINHWRQLSAELSLRRGMLAKERGLAEPDLERVAALSQQIEADEGKLINIESEIARENPNFYQAIGSQVKFLSVDEIKDALPAGAVLLQYFFLSEDILAWAITKNGLQKVHHSQIRAKDLARQIRVYQQACAKSAATEPLAAQIADIVIEPFAEMIRQSTELFIVPYGGLHLLPFHALPFDHEPLIATRTISYLPSASILQFLEVDKERKALPEDILAIGNPTGDLQYAGIEAQFVAGLFNQEPLLGDAATEQAVAGKLASHRLLHFATHGRLSEDAPMNSAIRLAQNEELTVYELMGMKLNAELVVLSACNTGKGKTTGGDDVLGLTRGLLAAGARATVVSLWEVNDISTSLLMEKFYRCLKAGETPASALKAAQNYLRTLSAEQINEEVMRLKFAITDFTDKQTVEKLIARNRNVADDEEAEAKDYHHPYYWAPFILVG